MSIERRSFRTGLAAGLLLLAGAVLGIMLAVRLDWMTLAVGAQPAPRAPLDAPPGQQLYVPVVKAAMPAVVNISTSRVVKAPAHGRSPLQDDPFFRHFFGEEFGRRFQIPRERREASLGSGVIVDAAGYIVTNAHVVEKADEIKVLLADKREFNGKVIGADPKSDIAVIKISASGLPTLPWGNSDGLEIGEQVLAIGNPFGLNQTVTQGIVSAIGRANVGIADYEDFIQTDAAINPGNSGGALVNLRGELVGINTAIFSRSGGYMGISFAVPSNMTRDVMQSLIKTGKVTRGWLGVAIQDVTPELAKSFGLSESRGALVGEVIEGSPAAKSGIRSGDVITGVNGKKIESPAILRNTIAQIAPGKTVKVEFIRDRKAQSMEVTIGEQPKDLQRAGAEPSTDDAQETTLRGLELQDLSPDISRQLELPAGIRGVVVSNVDVDSPAGAAGLQRGDVITEVNKTAVRSVREFERAASKAGAKENVLLRIVRQGSSRYVVLKP